MPVCRPQDAAAPRCAWRWAISLAGAVLIASLSVAPLASATLPGTGADGGAGIVSQVAGAGTPSLPSVLPSQPSGSTRPAQVPIPSGAPASADAPPAPPAPISPDPASAPPSGPGHVSSPGDKGSTLEAVTGGSSGAIGSETDEALSPTPPAGGEGADIRRVPQPRTGAGSVGSGVGAPLGRLRAYVWPAVALGSAGAVLGTLLVAGEIVAAPALSGFSRLILGPGEAVGADRRAAAPAKGSALRNPTPQDSRGFAIPSDSQISLAFIALCAALVASLVLMVRRELRSMHRRPL